MKSGFFVGIAVTAVMVAATARGDELTNKVTDLYTEGTGTNPSFQELIDKKKVIVGEKYGKPVQGTKIDVNNPLIESNLEKVEGTVRPDRIHTHVNSSIYPKTFAQWSRWYQEDGNTHVFRLFKGEQSVRSLKNIKAGRIEAVKNFPNPKPGEWLEWQGTYTIIKPGGGCIFQILVDADPDTGVGGLWPVHLDQSSDGDLYMTRRQPKGNEEKKVVVAKDVIGTNVSFRILFDGKTKYEVYARVHGRDDKFLSIGKGTYHPHCGDKVGFRWGIYQGSTPESKVSEDCMLFVTGVKIRYLKAGEK